MCEFTAHERAQQGVVGIVDNLVSALINERIYPRAHRRVTDPANTVARTLVDHLDAEGRDALDIYFSENLVVTNGRPQAGLSFAARALVDAIARCGCGGVRFVEGTTGDDVLSLIEVLTKSGAARHRDASAALERLGVTRIRLLPCCTATDTPERVELRNSDSSSSSAGESLPEADLEDLRLASVSVRTFQSLFTTLQECAIDVSSGREVVLEDANGGLESVLTQIRWRPGELLQASRYEQYDSYTFGHSVRVALLAMNFALEFIREPENVLRIGTAALFHDIGKVLLPYDLLHFRGRFDAEQRREMSRHTEIGAELLLSSRRIDPLAVAAALCHHQGGRRGYPLTVTDPRLSATTRLVKICDIYEALTAPRPYKASMSPRAAYSVMLSMEETVDRAMLRHFVRVNGLFPTGTRVRLDTGETAVVEQQSDDLLNPFVRILDDVGRRSRDREAPPLDLRASRRNIVGEGSERAEERAERIGS